MARPGPQPKNVRHGTGGAGWIDVPNIPYDGPGSERDLPDIPGMPWLPQVEAWWEVVRVMPHCRLWEASDWYFATMTGVLLNQVWSELFGGALPTTLVTELRRREDMMGMTVEARRKLGIRYVDPDQLPAAKAASAGPPAADADSESKVRNIEQARSRRQQLAG